MLRIVVLILALIFCGSAVAEAGQFATPEHLYTVKIIKRYDHELYGGFGQGKSTLGCSSDLFISNSFSLSFPCASTRAFKDHVYIFSQGEDYYACPAEGFNRRGCIECKECLIKDDELKALSLK